MYIGPKVPGPRRAVPGADLPRRGAALRAQPARPAAQAGDEMGRGGAAVGLPGGRGRDDDRLVAKAATFQPASPKP